MRSRNRLLPAESPDHPYCRLFTRQSVARTAGRVQSGTSCTLSGTTSPASAPTTTSPYGKALTWLGHGSSRIPDLYYHLHDADSQAAMRSLSGDTPNAAELTDQARRSAESAEGGLEDKRAVKNRENATSPGFPGACGCPLRGNGEGGIRTRGTRRFTGFRDRPIQPLWHLSGIGGQEGSAALKPDYSRWPAASRMQENEE